MKIKFLQVGKTEQTWLKEGIQVYQKRLIRYMDFSSIEINLVSNGKIPEDKQLQIEAGKLLALIKPGDWLVLLDDKGLQFNSVEFSVWLNKKFISIPGDLIFACGGAYGFHSSVIERADEKISLSPLTFTHQMVRLIFTEQLYRGMTILKNEPYHHS